LDAIYMEAVVALTGHGGWPMTVFLTPAGEPFFGGTYFPPEPRHGMPAFRQVLLAVSEAWRERRGDVGRQAEALVTALRSSAYLHGWLVTGEERYRRVAEETLDYMLRELRLPHGGFASAQDADTEGVEGLTFTWTEEEGVPPELLQPFEGGRSIIRGELEPELRR